MSITKPRLGFSPHCSLDWAQAPLTAIAGKWSANKHLGLGNPGWRWTKVERFGAIDVASSKICADT